MFTLTMGQVFKGVLTTIDFALHQPGDVCDWYRLTIEDKDTLAPGRVTIVLTDAQRRELIHTLGGIPVEPAIVHAGYRKAPADAPAEAS